MYRTFGFAPAGVRKGYYVETNEDAIIMWAHDVDLPEYQARLDEIERTMPGITIVDNPE
jgi:ribosomal-protein-alanine N-acetyltransferase